jgi:hypothetical protein
LWHWQDVEHSSQAPADTPAAAEPKSKRQAAIAAEVFAYKCVKANPIVITLQSHLGATLNRSFSVWHKRARE